MSGLQCTSDGYGNTGCIGTAVHAHSSLLPMTGLGVVFAAYVAVVLIVCGVVLRLRRQA